MKRVPLSKGLFALVDDEDYEKLIQAKWYASMAISNGKYYAESHTAHRLFHSRGRKMHRLLVSAPDGLEVDHINGNTLDNQKHNLRVCTKSENMFNRSKTKKNKSGYKGVHRNGKNWRARITVKGKIIELGYFENLKEAGKAYDEATKIYHKGFANPNNLGDN